MGLLAVCTHGDGITLIIERLKIRLRAIVDGAEEQIVNHRSMLVVVALAGLSGAAVAGPLPFTGSLGVQGSGGFELPGNFETFGQAFTAPGYFASGGTSGGIVGTNFATVAQAGLGVGVQFDANFEFSGTPAIFADALGNASFDDEFDTFAPDGATIGQTGISGNISWNQQFVITSPTSFSLLEGFLSPSGPGIDPAGFTSSMRVESVDLQDPGNPFDDIFTNLGSSGVLVPGLYRVAGNVSFNADPGTIGSDLLGDTFVVSRRFVVLLPTPGALTLAACAVAIPMWRRR